MHEHVSDQLVRAKKDRPDIMKSEKVIYRTESSISKNILSEKNQGINNYQILNHGRDRLKTVHSNICHPGEI
jgi:hypothetical protein